MDVSKIRACADVVEKVSERFDAFAKRRSDSAGMSHEEQTIDTIRTYRKNVDMAKESMDAANKRALENKAKGLDRVAENDLKAARRYEKDLKEYEAILKTAENTAKTKGYKV